MSVADDVRSVLAPPHPAGRPFIVGGLAVIMLGLVLGAWLSWIGLAFTLAACNTVKGIGQDVQSAGSAIERAAR